MNFIKNLSAYAVIATALCLFCSCGRKRKVKPAPTLSPPAPAKPMEVNPPKKNLDPKLSANAIAGDDPNQYTVKVSWPAIDGATGYVLKRIDNDQKLESMMMIPSATLEFDDSKVVPGGSVTYDLMAFSPSLAEVNTLTVKVPKDFVVSGNQEIGNISEGINRLFLMKDARPVTNGKDILIDVQELISENVVLGTFPDDQTAGSDAAGRSGGFIHIRAQRGTGTLFINATGENGGNGLNGAAGANGAKGARGVDGQDGAHMGERNPDMPAYHPAPQTFCAVETGDGGPGSVGQPGQPGHAGGKGGDSAKVLVEILEKSPLNVIPKSSPGRGGSAGLGGNGGQGGPGGDPGTRDPWGLCRIANPGAPGANGAGAANGTPGADGLIQPVLY